MKKLVRKFTLFLAPVFFLALAVSGQVMAEKAKATPKYEQKELAKSERVRVVENRWAPGSESPSMERPYRVVRVLKGGTLERIYPDGKTEKKIWKVGDVDIQEATPPYSIKNIGKTEVVLYVVTLK